MTTPTLFDLTEFHKIAYRVRCRSITPREGQKQERTEILRLLGKPSDSSEEYLELRDELYGEIRKRLRVGRPYCIRGGYYLRLREVRTFTARFGSVLDAEDGGGGTHHDLTDIVREIDSGWLDVVKKRRAEAEARQIHGEVAICDHLIKELT